MEVHAHTHTARKKWTHYLWEFIMLFLAVYCGFLAENIREHQIEKHRGKQYSISLYKDLKSDTIRINEIIQYNDEKINALNTIYNCYDTVFKNLRSTSCMGILLKHSRSNRGFAITDRTLKQLANAGGYRLLNKEDADSIINYENMYKDYVDFQTTVFQQAQDNVRNTTNQIANFKAIAPLQRTSIAMSRTDDTTSSNLASQLLFTEDRVLVNKWFNELALYLRITNGQRNFMIYLKNKAIKLLEFLKDKYHLE
jgi:hypothetical protein